jgi:hypothetical protein
VLTDDERAVLMTAATGKTVWEAIIEDGGAQRVSKAVGALLERGLMRDDETMPGVHWYWPTPAGIEALGEGGVT